MSFNPYAPPSSAYDSTYTRDDAGPVVSDRIVESLRKTRPWVVFLAVLGFIGGGLTVLLGIFGVSQTRGVGMGITLIAFGAIYVAVAIALQRFAAAINKMLHGGGVAELEQTLEAQAKFWLITGILALVSIVAFVVMIYASIQLGAAFFGD